MWDGSRFDVPVVPAHLLEVVARFARSVRDAPQVDQRSGVSARFAIAAVETVAASAVRRAAVTGEPAAVARVADLPAVIPASRGKVEFEDADEGREFEVLEHLLRRSIAETYRAHLTGVDLRPLQEKFDAGLTVTAGDGVAAEDLLGQLGPVPVLSALLDRLEPDGIGEGPAAIGVAAAVLEFAMEGLHLNKRLAKESDGGRTVYGQ
jgi:magnesium chelatase subunit I